MNGAILGGSPLGLIGVKSYYNQTSTGGYGMSTFNAGSTRNVKVTEYNVNDNSSSGLYGNSLFSGYRTFRAWPNIVPSDPKGLGDVTYYETPKKDSNNVRRPLHNDSIYDTSVLNIIEKLSGTKAQLRPADFAYLKNVGVYPNNRLMIARRFATPSDDNIMVPKNPTEIPSLATVISWVKENDNFLEMSFGEKWTDSEADFKNILTAMGEDIGLGKLGDAMSSGFGALPLPGFTEIFQRQFLERLGVFEKGTTDNSKQHLIPAGNPNLIKAAKRRELVDYSQAGSGLNCSISIKMTCEYELKYISGIDPTLVWMDLLSMIGRFGTSNSETYGLSKKLGEKFRIWTENPNILVNDAIKSLTGIVDAIKDDAKAEITKSLEEQQKDEELQEEIESNEGETPDVGLADKIFENIGGKLEKLISEIGKGLMHKYKVKILGVVHALSGMPSAPWHITIGNPLRPSFCSGDMLVGDISLKLGPILTFNDLPSSITVDFTMTNARPWGLQEILSKFNSGYLRTVDVQKTFFETSVITVGSKAYNEPIGIMPLNNDMKYESDEEITSGTSGTSGSSGTSGTSTNAISTVNNTNPTTSSSAITGTSGTSGIIDPTSVTKVGQEEKPEISKDAGTA